MPKTYYDESNSIIYIQQKKEGKNPILESYFQSKKKMSRKEKKKKKKQQNINLTTTTKKPSQSFFMHFEKFWLKRFSVVLIFHIYFHDCFCCSFAKSCPTFHHPGSATFQAPQSFTTSRSLLKFMSIAWVMLSSHLILCRALLLLPSIFPNIRVFSQESALFIRWPKY